MKGSLFFSSFLSVWCLTAGRILIISENWASSWSYQLKLLRCVEARHYKWNITFHFISWGFTMLQTNQKPRRPTLDLFHLNMTTIILQKIRSVSLLFSGDEGRRLFKDKCSRVHDPCSNHARRRRRRWHADAERNMFAEAAPPSRARMRR